MIDNSKDLGKAMKDEKDTIEIEFDYGKKVVKIIGAGKIVWGIAAASLASAVAAIMLTLGSGGTSAPATGTYAAFAGSTASLTLGPTVAYTALIIAVSGGGMSALNKLRKYKVIKKRDRYILKKK